MKQLTISLAILFLCTSCTHVYYAPNTANVPLFTSKDEMRITGLVASGTESEFAGGELQFAYALQKNWGVMLNTFTASRRDNTGDYYEKGSGSYVEVGGGYTATMDNKKRWIAEVYAGLGTGSITNDYGLGDRSKVGINKIFLQPAIGYKVKHFEIAFTPKLSSVNWKVKQSKITHPDHLYDREDIEYIRQDSRFFSFEPALIIRGGGEDVKAQLSLSFSNPNTYVFTDLVETLNASLGISIAFNTRKMK